MAFSERGLLGLSGRSFEAGISKATSPGLFWSGIQYGNADQVRNCLGVFALLHVNVLWSVRLWPQL